VPDVKDPRVDAYISALPPWQQSVCQRVRDIGHAADPEVAETIKRRTQPYFVLDGNVCALLASKDHVNVFLYDAAVVSDPARMITGGHNNSTARTIALYVGGTLNDEALATMIADIIANNRAGGWRRMKDDRSKWRRPKWMPSGRTVWPVVIGFAPQTNGPNFALDFRKCGVSVGVGARATLSRESEEGPPLGRGRRLRTHVHPLSVLSEHAQDLDRTAPGGTKPMRVFGVEFCGLAGAQNDVVFSDDESRLTLES